MITARIYRAQGNTEKEEAALKRVLEIAPDYPPALAEIVSLDLKANRFDAGQDRLQRALDRDPNNAQAALTLGWLCESKGNLDKAITYYLRALEADGIRAADDRGAPRVPEPARHDRTSTARKPGRSPRQW